MLFPTIATQHGLAILATLGCVNAIAVPRDAGVEHGLAAVIRDLPEDLVTRKIEPLVVRSSEEKRSPEAHYGDWRDGGKSRNRYGWYNYRPSAQSTTAAAEAASPTVAADAVVVVTTAATVATTTSAAAAAQTTAPATSTSNLNADQAGALKLHNDGRVAKGLTALIWDDALTANAQSWADHLASINSMTHSSGSDRPNQGENLAWSWSSSGVSSPMTQGAQMWMDEASSYHGEAIGQGDFASYGHYTQCMWSTTTKVGIAFATAADGGVYTVARYSEAGNMSGQKPY